MRRTTSLLRPLFPGMEKDSIEVNLADHTLTIKGEKKKGRSEVKEKNYYRSERFHGSFLRTLDTQRRPPIGKSLLSRTGFRR